jgi:mono/diheme cytochrome c family protein
MKKLLIILLLIGCCLTYIGFTGDDIKPTPIPASVQRPGDAAKGYQYLITGDYLKSGIPYNLFKVVFGKRKENYLARDSFNKDISYEFTAINAPNGERVVAPNCLQCHAQVFDNQLYVGLGNTSIDFSTGQGISKVAGYILDKVVSVDKKKYEASKNFIQATRALGGDLTTDVRGVNAADHLAGILASHRDPVTFKWSEKAMMKISDEVVPTDVPAWWLLKKKNAMFYNGFGRGDFGKFLMASNLLTVTDTTESREVYTHFNDVLAYLYSIEPPKFPKSVNEELAASGKALFDKNCSKCHGTYGDSITYPNLLIPASIIKTDSALYKANYSTPEVIDWFNKSWFTMGENPAMLVPFNGYIAPPLDGIWITAPYLHNGSVPTLEGVLNSKARPKYWSRNFDKPEYDYDNTGWKHQVYTQAKKKAYNTTLNGYGNYGHYFGDKLNNKERKAVIEYLKTL